MIPFLLPSWWKLAATGAIVVVIAAGAWKLRHGGLVDGRNEVRAEWQAKNLSDSENARLREQAAQKSNERVDRDYQTQKARLTADKRLTDSKLRDFATASADTDTSTSSRTDDPYRDIAHQCAAAIGLLDDYAKGVAGKATALQDYTRAVCLAK